MRLSITAQCKISFTQLLHERKSDLVHGFSKCCASFGLAYLQEYTVFVLFVQGTSDFCVSPDKFIVNQTKDFLSGGTNGLSDIILYFLNSVLISLIFPVKFQMLHTIICSAVRIYQTHSNR